MSRRIEYLKEIYENYDEDSRLVKSYRGRLEYMTTMNYIHRFACENARILEIGAATGRYSIALAREGYDVTAVELLEHNLEILRENSRGISNLASFQGDGLDLSRFGDDEFDMTLVFGPLYHLYDSADHHKAIDEAVRVTRPGGVIMFAFLSVYAIILTNYLYGDLKGGIEHNFDIEPGPDGKYIVKHTEDQVFTGFDIAEFEELFTDKPVEHLATAATDSVLELCKILSPEGLSEDNFRVFADYHLATCEIRELLGSSSHLLYICRKNPQ